MDSLEQLIDAIGKDEVTRVYARYGLLGPVRFYDVLEEDIAGALSHLENHRNDFKDLTETALTAVVAGCLHRAGYNAVAERNVGGHADLSVECKTASALYLAEAKIHHGAYSHLESGIRQLLDRYAAGRHNRAGMIIYIRARGVLRILREWAKRLAASKLCHFLRATDVCATTATFVSTHSGPSRNIIVKHHAVFLFYEPTD